MADAPSTSTQTMVTTIGATTAKILLISLGNILATHGLISGGAGVETFAGAGMILVSAAWSFWNSYGRAIVLAKLEVWKATAQAQAEALSNARVAGPTAAQIANKIPDPAVTGATVQKVITAGCILLLAAMLTGPVMAQGKPKLTGNVIKDIAAMRTDSTDGVQSAGGGGSKGLGDLLGALDAKVLPDLKYALALAQKSNSKVTAPCYQAWINIIETRQSAALGADGNPLPEPDPHIITTFEKLVELRNALQPDSDFTIACSPVATMVKRDLVGFIGVVISGGAGLATLVPGL